MEECLEIRAGGLTRAGRRADMSYQSVPLKQEIVIDKIVTIHYYEYMNDFSFDGESHPFWEFLCVDKGEIEVRAGEKALTLKKGEIIFHKPDEFHNLKANGIIAPNLVVAAFECDSPEMKFFEDKILVIDDMERGFLAKIIAEARYAFSSKLDDPYLEELTKRDRGVPFGSEQLIKLYLELFLINLIRRCNRQEKQHPLSSSIQKKNEQELYRQVIRYLEKNLYGRLTLDQICRDNLAGRSQLQKLFQEKHDCGIIQYYLYMKIEAAKQMIRNNNLNFTQISDKLGYTSIHYFSRQFKKITGMTPSEYASSIKVLSEKR